MNKLGFREKYSYGIGALGKDLVYAIVATYLMFYFTDVIGLNPGFCGTLFLVARLWDAVNDPMMGMMVDNTRSKWGKFRPWIFIGTVINAVVLVFLFKKPDLQGVGLYAYYSVLYILWGMTYTIMDIPFWSMIPALTSDKKEREKVSVIPRIFASLAWLIITGSGLKIIDALGNNDPVIGYGRFAVVIAIVFIITSLITCLNVKERVETPKNAEKINFKQTINIIKSNNQLMVFIGVVLSMNLVAQISGGVALYYFTYVVGNKDIFSIYSVAGQAAEIIGLISFPILANKISREKVFVMGGILPVIGLSLLFVAGFVAPQNLLLIAMSSAMVKFGSGLLLGSTTVMLADVVDYGEYKLGTRNESVIFSVQTLLVKMASSVSGWLVGVGLSLVGYKAGAVQTASTILGLRVLMIILPIICAIIMVIIYVKKYKLNGVYYDEIVAVIRGRKKEQEEKIG